MALTEVIKTTRNKCILLMIIQYRTDWKGHTMKPGFTCS